MCPYEAEWNNHCYCYVQKLQVWHLVPEDLGTNLKLTQVQFAEKTYSPLYENLHHYINCPHQISRYSWLCTINFIFSVCNSAVIMLFDYNFDADSSGIWGEDFSFFFFFSFKLKGIENTLYIPRLRILLTWEERSEGATISITWCFHAKMGLLILILSICHLQFTWHCTIINRKLLTIRSIFFHAKLFKKRKLSFHITQNCVILMPTYTMLTAKLFHLCVDLFCCMFIFQRLLRTLHTFL